VVGFLARHLNLSPGNGAFEMVAIVVGVVALGLIAEGFIYSTSIKKYALGPHLIGACEHGRRLGNAERFGGVLRARSGHHATLAAPLCASTDAK
jgi:hypothetical protein